MTMSRWITLRTTCKLDIFDQFNHLPTRQQIDKMLKDTKAIAECELHGIIAHSYLFFVLKFSFLRWHSLTRIFVSLYKKYLLKVNTKIFLWKWKTNFFFTLVFCLQKHPMIHCWTYAFEHNNYLQINKMKKAITDRLKG